MSREAPSGSAFDELVEQYLRGYPTHGKDLAEPNVRYTVLRLLMIQQQKDHSASAPQSWPAGAAVRLAACLFVLFVQENLMQSEQSILGTPVQEIFAIMTQLLRADLFSSQEFISAVEAVDEGRTALELLRQPDVVENLWTTSGLDSLWTSSARSALQTVDEMSLVSEEDQAVTHDVESAAGVRPGAVRLALDTELPPRALSPRSLWPARPRLRSTTGLACIAGLVFGVLGLFPLILQAARSPIVGRGEGQIPTTSLLPPAGSPWWHSAPRSSCCLCARPIGIPPRSLSCARASSSSRPARRRSVAGGPWPTGRRGPSTFRSRWRRC